MKHVSDTDHPFPLTAVKTYACHMCGDLGLILEEREVHRIKGNMYAEPCGRCQRGRKWGRIQASQVVEAEARPAHVPNRLLRPGE